MLTTPFEPITPGAPGALFCLAARAGDGPRAKSATAAKLSAERRPHRRELLGEESEDMAGVVPGLVEV